MQILIVVVRYKMPLNDSETIAGLSRTFAARPDLLDSMGVLIWDNSPEKLDHPSMPFPFLYRHTGENLGVSGAYNRAMEIAIASGCTWMLVFDQDTMLTEEFLPRMLAYSQELTDNLEIAAVAPFLLDGSRPISPLQVFSTRIQPAPISFSGEHTGNIFAANSGSMMRLSALTEIGGYDERFWLDLSDVVVFHHLYRKGKRLSIAGDLKLQHKVTNNDYDNSMSMERYRNFLAAEGAYWDLYRSRMQNGVQMARLLARSVKQYLRLRNKGFSKTTWKFFVQRLFTPKRTRLLRWETQSLDRNIPAVSKGEIVG